MKTLRTVLDIGIGIIFFISLFLAIYNGVGAFSDLMDPQEVYNMSITYMTFSGIGICLVLIRWLIMSFFPNTYEPSLYNNFGQNVCEACFNSDCICDETDKITEDEFNYAMARLEEEDIDKKLGND